MASNNNKHSQDLEKKLWASADKLRKNMDAFIRGTTLIYGKASAPFGANR